MQNPQGELIVKVKGNGYKLFLGMSVLAGLQAKHGQDVLERLEAPEGADDGWMPDLNIVTDVFAGALRRYHQAEAEDRWFIDDLISENATAFADLMQADFPDQDAGAGKGASSGNKRRPKAAG